MTKKTYGVSGLIDWRATIKVGGASLSVHFGGGAITKYGVVPAEYTTCDPVIQRIIEDSDYFATRRITLLRQSDIVEKSTAQPTVIKVRTVVDAREYLTNTLHINATSLRTIDKINQAAAPYGIKFATE